MFAKMDFITSADRPEFSMQRSAMATSIARHVANHGSKTPVPGLSVGHFESALPPTTYIYEPSFCVCVRGSKKVLVGEAQYVYDENHFLLTCLGLPTIIDMRDIGPGRPYTALKLDLDLNLARQIILEIDLNGVDVIPTEPAIAVKPMTADLYAVAARLIDLLDRPQDVAVMANLIHRELLYRLLTGAGGARLRQIVRIGSQGNRIARSAAWLRSNFARQLRTAELAEIAGMGVSTFHRHFQELTTMSPLQYQKHLRLHEARRLMLSEDMDAGNAALAVGYESVTQFNREYRRLFGDPPRRHLKALRH